MGSRVHLFIQSDRRRTTSGGRLSQVTKRREREFAISSPGLDQSLVPGDISGLFSSRLVASFGIEDRHLASVDSSCGESKLRDGRMWLVLHPFGTAERTSQFYTSLSSDRKTSPYMAKQYDSFVHRAFTIPTSQGFTWKPRISYQSFDTVIINNG